MIDYTPKPKTETYQKFGNKYKTTVLKQRFNPVSSGYNPRETKKVKSLSTPGGSASMKEIPTYTGTDMIGISIIHKSCLQPIFSEQSAKDAASMRR